MNLETICKSLKLEQSPKAVFVHGSQLWGWAKSESSDWDLLIIQDGSTQTKHAHRIDAVLYGFQDLHDKLKDHQFTFMLMKFLILLEQQQDADEASNDLLSRGIVHCDDDVRQALRSFSVELPDLCEKICSEFEKDMKVAKKRIDKFEVQRGKKVLLHSYLMLCTSIELVNKVKEPERKIQVEQLIALGRDFRSRLWATNAEHTKEDESKFDQFESFLDEISLKASELRSTCSPLKPGKDRRAPTQGKKKRK
jgi:hypothetical protein